MTQDQGKLQILTGLFCLILISTGKKPRSVCQKGAQHTVVDPHLDIRATELWDGQSLHPSCRDTGKKYMDF